MTILRPRQAYRLPHAQTFHEKLKTKFTSEPAKKKSAASVHQKAAPTLPGPWHASVATQPDKRRARSCTGEKTTLVADDDRSQKPQRQLPWLCLNLTATRTPNRITTTILEALYACFTASSGTDSSKTTHKPAASTTIRPPS